MLTPDERFKLLFPKQKKKKTKELRGKKMAPDTYLRMMRQKNETLWRLEVSRKEKSDREMADCTFKPHLNKKA